MFWTPNLCRICAKVCTTTYPIFTNSSTKELYIEAKFKKCFKINVCKDDFKPTEVCNECLDKLDEYSKFINLFVESNNKFESIIYQTNRSELQENWQNRVDYRLGTDSFQSPESGVIVKPEGLVLITQCRGEILNVEVENRGAESLEVFEQTPAQTVLRHSSEFYNKSGEINLEGFSYKKPEEDFTAFSGNIEDEQNKGGEPVEPSKVKPFKCNECNKSFMRKPTLRAHLMSHSDVKFLCDICDKSYPQLWSLKYHMKVHKNLNQCKFCLKSFPSKYKLHRHVRIHTNDRPFKCEFEGCDKMFSDKRNLVGHQAAHSKVRKFECATCKKTYKTNSQLKDHQKVHSNISFGCDVCGKSFKWKANLTAHLRKHTEFHCKKCKLDLRSKSLFLLHREECVG